MIQDKRLTDLFQIINLCSDVTFAYLMATVLCLSVEMPISALQKFIIPQRKIPKEAALDKVQTITDKQTNGENGYRL